LNVLIGPNASGKSNLLRAMELLREAGTNNLDDAIMSQGGIETLLWDGQAERLDWRADVDAQVGLLAISNIENLRYELCLHRRSFFPSYEIEREVLAGTKTEAEDGSAFIYLQRNSKEAVVTDENGQKIVASSDRLQKTHTLLSQTSRLLSNTIVIIFNLYLREWKIYQNLAVQPDSDARKSTITRKELQLSSTGENLISTLHTLYSTERSFRTQLIDAMQAAFSKDFEELEFPPAEDQRVQMRIRWKSLRNSHSAADLSEGTLKFLMLIAVLANPNRGELVAIDEPETYLHPSMFPIIAELATEASKSSQIIFTTHSPEFLTAIGVQDPTTAVLQNVGGETKLNTLDQQEMKRWLEKYKLGELFMSGDLEALV